MDNNMKNKTKKRERERERDCRFLQQHQIPKMYRVNRWQTLSYDGYFMYLYHIES